MKINYKFALVAFLTIAFASQASAIGHYKVPSVNIPPAANSK